MLHAPYECVIPAYLCQVGGVFRHWWLESNGCSTFRSMERSSTRPDPTRPDLQETKPNRYEYGGRNCGAFRVRKLVWRL